MDLRQIKNIVANIRYKPGWHIDAFESHGLNWIRVRFEASSSVTGEVEEQKGRKFHISEHAVVSEVVRTCLLAVLLAEEHEARESFLFCGRPAFGPHIDVGSLCDASRHHDRRREPALA